MDVLMSLWRWDQLSLFIFFCLYLFAFRAQSAKIAAVSNNCFFLIFRRLPPSASSSSLLLLKSPMAKQLLLKKQKPERD
jgi:hypothetical protein